MVTGFTLSACPPSVNQSTAVVGGRKIKTKTYRSWQLLAGYEISSQKPKSLPEKQPYAASVYFREDMTGCDLDNLIKAVLDIAAQYKITPDDRYLKEITARFITDDDYPAVYASFKRFRKPIVQAYEARS